MTFQPGQVTNPNGRKVGPRNKRTQQILDLIAGRGDKDPLDFLSEVISGNGSYTPELKVQAANIAAPYIHSKRGTIPAPRFVDEAIQVPDFNTIDEAQDFQKEIARRAAAGELELQTSLDISALVGNWIRSRQASVELDIKVAGQRGLAPEQRILIEGGLPPLPGTNVIMPEINGHNGHTLDLEKNPGPELPAPAADNSTSQDPGQ